MNITVSIDSRAVEKMLGNFAKQAPYIVQQTINETAKAAQQFQVKQMRRSFTIRRDAFVKRSIKISQFARKDNLLAVIKVADMPGRQTASMLTQHEKGNPKRVRQGRNLAIPSNYVQPNKSRVVNRALRPANMRRAYRVKVGGREFLFVRVGKGKSSRSNLAYSLKPQVHLQPRLDFQVNVAGEINRTWRTHFNNAYKKAIATAR